jgi:hypothetical protein
MGAPCRFTKAWMSVAARQHTPIEFKDLCAREISFVIMVPKNKRVGLAGGDHRLRELEPTFCKPSSAPIKRIAGHLEPTFCKPPSAPIKTYSSDMITYTSLQLALLCGIGRNR